MASQIYSFVLLLSVCAVALGVEDPALRIIGGKRASVTAYPYLVSIRIGGRHHCGGAIISKQHILTAAHCIHGHIARPYYDVIVVSGTDSLNVGGDIHLLRGAYVHGEFDPINIKNDIGVLVLAGEITFNSKQKQIALPSSDFVDYSSAVIAGFGRSIQVFKQQISPILKSLNTQIVHPYTCASYGVLGATPGQLCGIQSEGKGTCQGDSGGPLVFNGQVVGVVSHGTTAIDCGLTPDIYTDVYYYEGFIQNVIQNY